MWLSDNILARIDFNRIITCSKSCYELLGPIDTVKQDSRIISSEFIEGFPENWKDITANIKNS